MIKFIFDTQMLVEGQNLSEDTIRDHITNFIPGDCLLVIGSDNMIRIHFHTNVPWKVLEYVSQLGQLHDIIIENMQDQLEQFEKKL